MGADPGHHEHRSPNTSVPTEASGWRGAQLDSPTCPTARAEDVEPGRSGEQRCAHSMSRPAARRRFRPGAAPSESRMNILAF
jgi:hypothetical protein